MNSLKRMAFPSHWTKFEYCDLKKPLYCKRYFHYHCVKQWHDKIKINVREHRRGNQEWTIQRHWQHWVHKAQAEDKHN